jgi:hypothetical protein
MTYMYSLFTWPPHKKNRFHSYIQDLPGGQVNIMGGHSIGHSKQYVYGHVSYSEQFPSWSRFAVHCTDKQHAMSSHELQSALMLTVEFQKT